MALFLYWFITTFLIFTVAFCIVIVLFERDSFGHYKTLFGVILTLIIFLFEQD
jgi:uncharacterized membrane protein